MPIVEHEGARVHWTAFGRGEPLALVMGLGCSSAMWFRLAPVLARRHRVILLDNRGVGLTETSPFALVHRVTQFARDLAAVLDAAGEASAHVLGLSMGGMIAQQFALDFPHRVRSLLLAATNCGGAHAILAESHVWRLLFSKGSVSPEAALAAMRPYTYARETPDTVIDEDHLVRLSSYPTPRGYQAQLYGLMGWTSWHRLPGLRCPTLVLHGEQDQLIPPANGELLARRIPGARLQRFAQASHWLHSDQPQAMARAVSDFISASGSTTGS